MSTHVIHNSELQTTEDDDCLLVISLLIKKFSLNKINNNLPLFWPEYLEILPKIQLLAQDSTFEFYKLAALIASKINFLSSDLEHALEYALLADELFDPRAPNEYNTAIVYKSFEKYIEISRNKFEDICVEMPPRLDAIVSDLVRENLEANNLFIVVGFAVETRSIKLIEDIFLKSNRDPALLSHCIDCVSCSYDNLPFREEVIQKVLFMYTAQEHHSISDVAKYLFMLNDRQKLINLLKRLIYHAPDSESPNVHNQCNLPAALQICFDLYENCQQEFLSTIIYDLQSEASLKTAELVESGVIDVVNRPESGDTFLTTSGVDYTTLPYLSSLQKLVSILEGTETNKLYLDFLVRSIRYEFSRLKAILVEFRTFLAHLGGSISNAFVHLGTTSDTLIRVNDDWISRAYSWSRFTMVAAMGLIHRGHGDVTYRILQSYLPQQGKSSSPHAEGGALFGIGLSYVNCGFNVSHYFTPHITKTTNSVVLHGACLGLGLASFGSNSPALLAPLKEIVELNEAMSSEAAAMSLGMIMITSMNREVFDLFKNVIMTSLHDKSHRGALIGMSLLFTSQTRKANSAIEEFIHHELPIARMAGIYIIATAYVGTNDPYAMRLLWTTLVSDTQEDVQRAAIVALSFVMFREPDQFLIIASMFVNHHSIVLRCGAILALGFVFAGTGNEKVLNIIKPFSNDSYMIVRQTYYVACGFIVIQNNEKVNTAVAEARTTIFQQPSERNNDIVGRFGGYLAMGIMDVGGRNQNFSFITSEGHVRLMSVVGALVFQISWYWFPFSLLLSLCFVPTAIILVNPDLEMPKIKFACDVDIEQFAYPEIKQNLKKDSHEKSRVSQLSQGFKSRGKSRRYLGKDMDVSYGHRGHSKKSRNITIHATPAKLEAIKIIPPVEKDSQDQQTSADETKNAETKSQETQPVNVEEPVYSKLQRESTLDAAHALENPCRAVPRQLPHMSIDKSSLPLETIKPVTSGGIIVCYSYSKTEQEKLKSISTTALKPNVRGLPSLNLQESDLN